MADGIVEPTEEPKDESRTDVNLWAKRFKQSEKLMKDEFSYKYQLAKTRLRAEYEVKNRRSRKMTHKNVNLVQSIGSNFVNSIYFKAPHCNLIAREEEDHDRIENTEVAANDWLKDNKVKKTVKRCIWDAFLGGFGLRYIDHIYNDYESDEIIGYEEAPVDVGNGAMVMVPDQSKPIFKRIVTRNEIVIYRIRPDMVRFPRGFDFDTYQESPWIGFDMIMPIDEVKNNENWDPNVREAIEGERYDKLSDSDGDSGSEKGSDADDLYAKISFAFVKPETDDAPFKLLVFHSKHTEAPLTEIEYDKGHVGYPVKPVYFNPLDDDCPYPNGDPWNMESQLSAVDTWWRKYVLHVERSNPKTVYDSGVIPPTEVQKLKANNDLEFVGLKNKERRPISELIKELQRAPVHGDTDKLYEVARQLLDEIAPKSSLSGGSGAQTETATEAKIKQMGEVIDIEARLDDVRTFIEDIVLDVAGILSKSFEAAIPVRREIDGQEVTMEVNKDGFTSKIKVDVEVESMQAQNKDVFRRQILDTLKFLTNFEPIMNKKGLTLEPIFWLERIMETMNIRNVEKGIAPLPPPVQQQNITPDPQAPIGDPTISGEMPPEAIEAARGQMT